MFRRIIVYLLLFSFLLGCVPQAVLAGTTPTPTPSPTPNTTLGTVGNIISTELSVGASIIALANPVAAIAGGAVGGKVLKILGVSYTDDGSEESGAYVDRCPSKLQSLVMGTIFDTALCNVAFFIFKIIRSFVSWANSIAAKAAGIDSGT